MTTILKVANNMIKKAWLDRHFKQELAILKLADMPKALEEKLNSIQRGDSDFQLIKKEIETLNQKYYGKAISVLTVNPNISFDDFKSNFEKTEKSKSQKSEDLLTVLLKKYPNYTDTIKEFASNDPSGSLKYLAWQTKIFESGQAPARELIDIVDLFHKYSDKLDKKDINQYKPGEVAILRDTLFSFENQKKERNLKEESIACGNKEVYRSDICVVKHIFNIDASCHYGTDTRWCISGGLSRNYFNDYDSNNVVFFFILTKFERPYNKVAIIYTRREDNSIESRQIFNSNDDQINSLPEMFNADADKIFSITKSIADSHPKSIVAKLESGEANSDEIQKLYDEVKNHEDKDYWREIREKMILRKNTPGNVLRELALNEQLNDDDLTAIAGHPNTPKDVLTELSYHDGEEVRIAVSENANTSSEDLLRLSAGDYSLVAENAIAHINFPIENLIKLSKHKHEDIRFSVARNPSTPIDVLVQLSNDEKTVVRSGVARNINCPQEILAILANDEKSGVREGVAINKNTQPEILMQLSSDLDSYVANSVARNTNTSPEALAKLTLSNNRDIMSNVASNPNTSINTLISLHSKNEFNIGMIAAQNLEIISKNENTTPESLAKLYRLPIQSVRENVAKNKNTPIEILKLMSDKETDTIKEYARINLANKENAKMSFKSINQTIKLGNKFYKLTKGLS